MNIILNKIFIINRTTQLHQAQPSWDFLFPPLCKKVGMGYMDIDASVKIWNIFWS